MKRVSLGLLSAGVLALSVAALSAHTVFQNDKLDFTLVNKTGLTIEEIYVSPTSSDTWGEDILGRDVLEDEEKVDISFSPKAKTCLWDLKIVDDDKDEVEWEKLNLCEANEITLRYEKGGKPTAIIK